MLVGHVDGDASTEPRSFERGDPGEKLNVLSSKYASTEPRSFERGDKPQLPRGSAAATALQRSRALSSAEMST